MRKVQRNQFKVALANAENMDYIKETPVSQVNTFSDCIKDATYKTSHKQAIRVKNPDFDRIKNLI